MSLFKNWRYWAYLIIGSLIIANLALNIFGFIGCAIFGFTAPDTFKWWQKQYKEYGNDQKGKNE